MTETSNKQFNNVCTFFGFHYEKYKEFVQAPIDLGQLLVERKIHLLYKGGAQGLPRLV